ALSTGDGPLDTSAGAALLASARWGPRAVEWRFDEGAHRIALQQVELDGLSLIAGSVYLVDGVGLAEPNLTILGELGEALAAQQRPFLLGGDWNADAGDFAELAWVSDLEAAALAPDQPTINDKRCDFFLASKAPIKGFKIPRKDEAYVWGDTSGWAPERSWELGQPPPSLQQAAGEWFRRAESFHCLLHSAPEARQ
ncbi:unnamed protein product, partial [Prorocentrum cordatum]